MSSGTISKHVIWCLILFCTVCLDRCNSGKYEWQIQLYDTLLNPSVYKPHIRPLDEQSESVPVQVFFQLVSILGIDEVGESLQCNGFLAMNWVDERLRWDPADYGGEVLLRPNVKDIWKPRVLVLNTLTERDVFEDDNAPLSVEHEGEAMWVPGSVFSTSCDLNMLNYPFDIQTCHLDLISNGFEESEVKLIAPNQEVFKNFFFPNGEWDLIGSNVTENNIIIGDFVLVGVRVTFVLQRRPTFVLLNIIIPVVLLSFLNILVFLIPVESGEKLSYGITVLLAVSVFLSIISSLLPRSSKIVPNMTIYLACLLIMSVLTVVDCIIIVFLHNLEECENVSIKAKENFQRVVNKVKDSNSAENPPQIPRLAHVVQTMRTSGFSNTKRPGSPLSDTSSLPPYEETEHTGRKHRRVSAWGESTESSEEKAPRKNKYRYVGKHIDMVSFIVFFLIWLGLTVGFMAAISSSSGN